MCRNRTPPGWLPAIALLMALPCAARAGDDPARRWRTLATPHVRMHFESAGEAMARRAAAFAEEAHRRIRELTGFEPSQPVEMVLTDFGDDANGAATVYPYDRIVLQAAPPDPGSELATFDDYLRTLVLHEYLHVAHMDQVSGFPAFANRLLGKSALPNGAAALWFIEGLATFVETRTTGGGRLGGTAFERVLRSAVLGGTFLDLPEMTVTPLKLPRGAAPYVYGSAFLDFLYARGGIEALRTFVRDYGARIVPFAMNTVARRAWGRDFLELYAEFRAGAVARFRAQADRVRAAGLIEGTLLTTDGEYKASPVFRPDGAGLWYVRSDASSEGGVFDRDLRTGRERRRWDCRGGCGRLSAAGGALYTTHGVPHRVYNTFGDAYRLGPGSPVQQRLTRRARARDLAATADGSLLYVTAEYDRVSLARRAPDGRTTVVVPAGLFASIGDPRPLPDGRVVFSGARDGRWDLWAARPDGTLDRLTDDGCLDRDPVPTPDGRWLLFVSDPGGIDDVLALDLATGERRRVTRVLGGVAEPDVSPDGSRLVFATYSSRGWDLATLPLQPDAWPRPGAGDTCRETLAAIEPPPVTEPAGRYSAWPSLRARALHPRFSASTAGDVVLGADISGFDAIGHHSFALGIESDLRRRDPVAWGSYAYHGWWASLGLDLATWQSAQAARVDDRWVAVPQRAWLLDVSASLPIPLRTQSLAVGLGYSVRWVTGSSPPRTRDPASTRPLPPSEKVVGGLTFTAVHDSTRSFERSVGPSQGVRAGVTLGLRHPVPADGEWALTLAGHLFGYLPMPWKGDQVLAFLGSAAGTFGDRAWRDVFVTGGFPSQDLMSALVNREPMEGRFLRGFRTGLFSGDAYALVNAEYRAPLWYVHRGLGTFPVAARRLWATAFADGGGAWWEGDRPRLAWDVGVELALSFHLLQWMDATFRLGYAHGFGPDGGEVVYFLLTP